MINKDIYRPIFGTVMLQPPAYIWCQIIGIPYIESIGLFTVFATLYLMPLYAWFERKFPQP
jgi:hypothetical protein|tara:strand:+ start:270 stop:452 length:183 start_codon:yes stop_codon:yes gene_type:complete